MTYKIFAYTRVSTDEQTRSGLGLEAQAEACNTYAKREGKELQGIFSDAGISGAAPLHKRIQLMRAIDALKKGDILLVAKRDRLARDLISIATIESEIAKRGARIVSAAGEGTGSEDAASVCFRGMIDVFSQFERNIIRDRIKSAMAVKKSRGERVGYIPFGWRVDEDCKYLIPDETEQAILAQMKELRVQGLTLRDMAVEMNKIPSLTRNRVKWNHVSIHRILKNNPIEAASSEKPAH